MDAAGAKAIILTRDAGKAASTINEIMDRAGNTVTDSMKCDLAPLDGGRKTTGVFMTSIKG